MTGTGHPKRVTAMDVARSLGLSRATVGFALNNTPGQRIPEQTRLRVLAEAERLGYRPHRAAQALASGQSRIVLLVLPDWPIDYSMRVHLDEASHVLDSAGYSLVTTTVHRESLTPPLWEKLDPEVVLGLVPFTTEQRASLRRAGIRRIFPEQTDPLPFPNARGFAEGPRKQVEHLVSVGRNSLAFAGTTDPRLADLVTARRRLAGHTALSLTGRTLAHDADIDQTNVDERLVEWVRDGIDGVIAYNDDVAALLVGAALRQKIAVPGTLAVIGHDDTPLASLFVPAISSVRIDSAGLGRYMAETALAAINGHPISLDGSAGEAVVVRRATS